MPIKPKPRPKLASMMLPTSDTKSNPRVYATTMATCLVTQTLQTFKGLMMPNPNPNHITHTE